jgi:hypothetical protein
LLEIRHLKTKKKSTSISNFNFRLKDALEQVFDSDKKLLLIETGLQSVEKMLKEQYDIVSNELQEKKAKLDSLRKKNTENSGLIRELNTEIEGMTYHDPSNR